MKLTLNEFKDDYSGINIDLIELAEAARLIDDSYELYSAAKSYLEGIDQFKRELKKHNIEIS